MKSITKVCPNCEFTTKDDLKFCPECGTKLVEKAEVPEETIMVSDELKLSGGSTEVAFEKIHNVNLSLFRNDFNKSALFEMIYCITILLSFITFLFIPMYMLDPSLNTPEAYYSIFDIIKYAAQEVSTSSTTIIYVILPIIYMVTSIIPIFINLVRSILDLVGGDDKLRNKYEKVAYDLAKGFERSKKTEKGKTKNELFAAISVTLGIIIIPFVVGYLTEYILKMTQSYDLSSYLFAGLKNINFYSVILYILLTITLAAAIFRSVFANRLNNSIENYIVKNELNKKK